MSNLHSQRLADFRHWLHTQQLDAFIVPHEDEYLGEYVPEHNERLHWLTGFTGSAGAAIVTVSGAAIFVDGRYTVQVRKQVSSELFEYCHLIEQPYLDWLVTQLPAGAKVGYDPRMHRGSWLTQAQKQLAGKINLCAVSSNPIDVLWQDRPVPAASEMRLMPLDRVGQSSLEKRQSIASTLRDKNADCVVLTELDSIAWLLNIRGLDVSRLPVLLSHAIVHNDSSVDFFFDPARLATDFDTHVAGTVRVHHPDQLEAQLHQLSGRRVMLDSATSNAWFTLTLQNAGAELLNEADPCLLPKAAKNSTEIAGMRACHIRDGAAMVQFLAWLDNEVANGRLHNEAELADRLEAFRRQDPTLVDLSFDTISAAGTNAAMCHYNHQNQPEPGQLSMDSLYLVDSGGQYLDGTTDITRTVAIGEVSAEMKQQFTLVLKGHIALARARFPKGTTGSQLDVLARQHLWAQGYDYDHGTGHGVGHFLSVHEGPQRIAKVHNSVALRAGMVLSNEPGYYRADAFGIRIENLELVTEFATQGDFSVLGFESLTRCPIDKRAIEVNLLTKPELHWLNQYHQKVWDEVSPFIKEAHVREWLQQATSPLSHV
ncbi:aminopeptidase P family protein [Vibrio cholerae]|uniref:aminopeptidase P family protein n=1 Tax=Vibrio cholerae TaxID=666 RepID=UPI0002734833|nr:aminopeptidase P family protein [Vibrio cholerae]EGR1307448.1 aminopeptidase P family protein [Vibrio cholerae]EJH67388.1 metallopeptidase M24 family protein [Vibrio cholerae HE-25]EJL6314571.1 aminopeptidase P family protein [Vibrio cholerae]MDV2318710.1 aminopeptidase P family protein [Vibrio cholerae]TXY67358.1 aminopeptidase P family protein [Vibrio cholerae]